MLDPNKSQHSSSENPEESLNDSLQALSTEQIMTNNVQHNDGEFGQECIQSADESQDESDVDDDDEEDNDETEIDDEETEDECDEEEEEDSDAAENENENNSALDKGRMSPNSAPTCYICLNNFEGQDIGSPNSCENMHHFCLECIEEWSKQINTCPVDRKSFSFIIVRRVINGEIVMKVPIAKKSVVEIVTMGEDLTYCEICGRCDREDRLLLCDGCDFGYHCECLVPPLETIPVDEWFCPDCFQRLFGHDSTERNNHRQRQRQLQQQRRVARTGAFERVRNRILALRSNIPTRSSRTTATVRRKTKRKPRRKRTRKTKSRTTKTTTKKGTKKRTKKSRKRTRKSKFSMQRLPAADPRSRLATKLGLVCKSPFGLPATKAPASSDHPQNRSLAEVRYSAGINNLSLFGYELEVYNPVSYGDEDRFDRDTNFDIQDDVGGGSIGLLTNPRFYTRNVNRKSIQAPEPSLLQMNNVDVLSEIMNSQEILHASSCDLSVARDGRVYLNPDSMKNNHNNNHRQCPNSSPPPSSSNHGHSSTSSNSSWNDNNKNTTNTSITSNKNGNSENNSSYGQSSYNNSSSNTAENNEDISFVKPSPVVSLIDDKNDIEMYSDIESIGDNKDLDDNEENNKKLDDKPVNTENDINQQQQEQEQQQLKPSVPDTDADNGEKMPESSNSSSIITATKASSLLKRRPSIKDLFGGDSEEEDDSYGNDLKQLVAQQGSINVHFPIKMPIVLKSNFLTPKKRPLITTSISSSTLDGNESKNVQVDEISISKKWVPIYPEMNATMKKVGPKWKAIGETEKQPLDKRNATVVVENDGKKSRKNHSEKSDVAKAKSYLDDNGDHDNRKHENVISDKKRHSSSDKVRTCKHGRPLNKSNKEPSNLKRSHSETASSDASKKPKQVDMENSTKFEVYEKLGVIKHSKTTKIETAKREQSLDLQMMMDIEEKFLYKDETIILKKSDDQNFDLHKHRRKQPLDDDTPTTSKQISKTLHRLESKAICSNNYKVDLDKSLSSGSSSSKLQPDEYRDSSSREQHHHHHHRSSSNKEFNDSKHHHHHHHHRRHHHHRHHHSSSRRRQEHHDSVDYSHRSSRTGRQANVDDNDRHKSKGEKMESKSKNHHQQSFSNVQLDSKEIFAEGDKIIINVNFKKEQEKLPLEEKNKKNTEPPKNLIIEAQSPKDLNIDEEEEGVLFEDKSPDISVASPNDDEFDNYVNLIKTGTPTSSLSSNDKIPNSTILAEELNFLPRLNTDSSNNGGSGLFQNQPDRSPGSKSPDDLFIDDYSFLPTPTQDESQSPVLDSGHQRKQFNDNNSNNRKADVITLDDRDKIDEDFYDPELPLQSPDHFNYDDDDSMIKSPKLESSSIMSISNANLIGKDSSSSLSSDLVAAAAKLATFNNSINFSQIMNNMNKNTFKNQQNAHGDNNGGGGGSNSCSKFTGNNQSSSNYNINKGHSSETINNSDIMEIVDMDVESPGVSLSPAKSSDTSNNNHHSSSSLANVKEIWDQIVKKASTNLQDSTVATSGKKINNNNGNSNKSSRSKSKAADVDATQPVSAVEMNIKEKFIKKLNRQERVVEEVKLILKPYYKKKKISKDEYKDILRKSVPKICHSKSGEINPTKIYKLIEAYIKHMRRLRKKN